MFFVLIKSFNEKKPIIRDTIDIHNYYIKEKEATQKLRNYSYKQ